MFLQCLYEQKRNTINECGEGIGNGVSADDNVITTILNRDNYTCEIFALSFVAQQSPNSFEKAARSAKA